MVMVMVKVMFGHYDVADLHLGLKHLLTNVHPARPLHVLFQLIVQPFILRLIFLRYIFF